MSIGVIALDIILSLTILKAGILRNDINVQADIIITTDPGLIKIPTREFSMAVKLEDPEHDFSYSMIGVRLVQYNTTYMADGTPITTEKAIGMRPCLEEDFPNHEIEYYFYGLYSAICPEDDYIYMKGLAITEEFFYIQLYVEECDDARHAISGITCAPKVVRDAYLDSHLNKVMIHLNNTSVSPNNLTHPFENYLDMYYYIINRETLAKYSETGCAWYEFYSYEDFLRSEKQGSLLLMVRP